MLAQLKAKPLRESEHENEVWEVSMHDVIKHGMLRKDEDYDEQLYIGAECRYDPREVFF